MTETIYLLGSPSSTRNYFVMTIKKEESFIYGVGRYRLLPTSSKVMDYPICQHATTRVYIKHVFYMRFC